MPQTPGSTGVMPHDKCKKKKKASLDSRTNESTSTEQNKLYMLYRGGGWGLGEMELRVGSNIMIHFLYISLLLVWHMYLLVVIIICITFVKLRKCWRML